MLAKDFGRADGVDLPSFFNASAGRAQWSITSSDSSSLAPVLHGTCEGKLYGGCLSLLVASLGTPYEIQTDDTILFLEDLAEWPYRIDRMLMHLKYAGKLEKVRGIIFGEMMKCAPSPDTGYTLQQIIALIVADLDLKIPVAEPYSEENLNPRPDLVVVGNAISRGNVELEYVLDHRIPLRSLPQVLYESFLRGREPIAVTGTHGKTTTTSMLSWIFQVA